MEWAEEHQCPVEEIATGVHHEGNPCHLAEMFICPQEMMDILQKIAIQAENIQVLEIHEIMHHHQKIILTAIMVIPIHEITIHQAAIVTEMDMVRIVTIQIIQVEVPTEIHMRVMETHAVHPLHEGHHHLMELL